VSNLIFGQQKSTALQTSDHAELNPPISCVSLNLGNIVKGERWVFSNHIVTLIDIAPASKSTPNIEPIIKTKYFIFYYIGYYVTPSRNHKRCGRNLLGCQPSMTHPSWTGVEPRWAVLKHPSWIGVEPQ
jgi:hypothetical protein